MRVADRGGRQLDPVDGLGRPDGDLAHVGVRVERVEHPRGDRAAGCLDRDLGQRPISAASQRAAIRTPLPDISAVEPSGFQIVTTAWAPSRRVTSSTPSEPMPVSTEQSRCTRAGSERPGVGLLDDEVAVAERVPLRELHAATVTWWTLFRHVAGDPTTLDQGDPHPHVPPH